MAATRESILFFLIFFLTLEWYLRLLPCFYLVFFAVFAAAKEIKHDLRVSAFVYHTERTGASHTNCPPRKHQADQYTGKSLGANSWTEEPFLSWFQLVSSLQKRSQHKLPTTEPSLQSWEHFLTWKMGITLQKPPQRCAEIGYKDIKIIHIL